MKKPEVSIPVSILEVAIQKLTPVQFKKLMVAIMSLVNGTEGPDDIDVSTGIILDMFSSHLSASNAKRRAVSESRRASANARWSRRLEPEDTTTELPPVPEVIQIEEVVQQIEPASKTTSFVPNNSFLEHSPIRDVFLHWIDYKKKRRSSYNTQMSYEACHNKLMKLSGGNPEIASEIVEDSIANSYLGLFPLKNQQNGPNTQYERQVRAQQQLVDSVAQRCADRIQREQSSNSGNGQGKFVPPTI